MFNYKSTFIKQDSTIIEAFRVIEESGAQIALVVDENEKLLGTLTDGDLRRSLLNSNSLNKTAGELINKEFISLGENYTKDIAIEIMKQKLIRQIPIVDKEGKVVDLILLDLQKKAYRLENHVVIMAGGKGKRLRPYTENCPKPMLKIGDQPMLEIILKQCISCGFYKFYFSVNYLKDQILDYFQDGKKWNVSIEYLIENEPLGTAGSLHLIPKTLQHPFLILNGDVLTKLKPNQLINYHLNQHSHATICAREYQFNVPFGVIETNGLNLTDFKEKPDYKYLVNAGLYVLDPVILTLLSEREEIDMPELLIKSKQSGYKVKVCPIHEYWIDIGRPESLKQAYKEWNSSL